MAGTSRRRARFVRSTPLPGSTDAQLNDDNGEHEEKIVVLPDPAKPRPIGDLGTNSCVHITLHKLPEKVFSDDISQLAALASHAELAWVNIIVNDVHAECADIASKFGFSRETASNSLDGRYAAFFDNDTEVGLMLPSVVIEDKQMTAYPVAILVRDGLVLTVQDRHITRFARFARYAETYMRKIPTNWTRVDKLTAVLLRLLDENNGRNFQIIRDLGEEIDHLSAKLAKQKFKLDKVTVELRTLKHSITTFLLIMWENYDVMRSLHTGDIVIISSRPDMLDRFLKIVHENANYIQLGEQLGNILGTGWEIVQDHHAIHLLKMNNRISLSTTWLGVIGTIFLVPNTIATIMSTSSYPLGPDDAIWYSAFLIGSTVVSCGITYVMLSSFWEFARENIKCAASSIVRFKLRKTSRSNARKESNTK